MWLLPWEHDKVFLHKCKEDRKLMVPTKQLWLCLDVIILLAGSQTSEYGSVSQTNKLQGLLSTHGKCLIWAGSSLCFVVMTQAVQLFLAWCEFHRSRYRIFAFVPALRAPEQGSWSSVSSWYQEIHQPCSCSAPLIPAVLWSSADTLCWPIRTPGRQQHLCKANRHGHLASGEGLGSSRALCSPVPWPVFICSV